MFFNHFGLTEHPFAETPKAEALMKDERFEKALNRLEFFRQTGRLALIIGQTGTGKSSLLRLFTRRLPGNQCHPVYFHMTPIGPNALLRMIVSELGEAPKLGKDRLFAQLAGRVGQDEGQTLLIIDEAHLLPSQALTDLRLLISTGLDETLPLAIILCGQEPLGVMLKRSAHADLLNRICVRVRLGSLTPAQTAAYIDHRIRTAGGTDRIFDPEAKKLIHEFSGGICRQINSIATACLIHACDRNLQKVGEESVHESMSEFKL